MLQAIAVLVIVTSCKVSKSNLSQNKYQMESILDSTYTGFVLYDLIKEKKIYEHNAPKYFIPASNTKMLTTYAALKTFNDSIPGWKIAENETTLYLEPLGDPTFLHPSFKVQKLWDKLIRTSKRVIIILPEKSLFGRMGQGWSWGSYQENYVQERAIMPIYGNKVFFRVAGGLVNATPSYFNTHVVQNVLQSDSSYAIQVFRDEFSNKFEVRKGNQQIVSRPFTFGNDHLLSFNLLNDTLRKANPNIILSYEHVKPKNVEFRDFYTISTDSLLSIMMKNSDNFLAEQILIMVGKNKYNIFDDRGTISRLNNDVFGEILSKGRWVDGSGLSRSNLISPDEYIRLLKEIYNSSNYDRLLNILPHGDEGTLSGRYKGREYNIFAKTGSLGDHIALSGYLKTKKNNTYAFSFLINNFRGNINIYRNKIESVLTQIIDED